MKNARMLKELYGGGIEKWWLKWRLMSQEHGMACYVWLITSSYCETK
jgi:hypothetical protein